MKVGLVYGFWGQNIGNAFFNIGGELLLRETVGMEGEVYLVQDQPAYWTFRNEERGSYAGAFPLVELLEIDVLVLQGPFLTRNFANIWQGTLEQLARRGVAWAGLGVGMRRYDGVELAALESVVRRAPPLFLSTRDRGAYRAVRGRLGKEIPVFDSIDSAFYLGRRYSPPKLDLTSPLLALTFDHYPEPRFVPDLAGPIVLQDGAYRLEFSRSRTALARVGKAAGMMTSLLPYFRGMAVETSIGGYKVVRPHHRSNPHLPVLIYRQPSGLASDEPFSYLTIYNSAELTISDRVHACVAAMAYGNPAMLFNPGTRRSQLFERVGAIGIGSKPAKVSQDYIAHEFDRALTFLRRALGLE